MLAHAKALDVAAAWQVADEEDDDVLVIADMAARVIETGRAAAGSRDIRCTVSIGGFVPKPHTPFQWAAQASAETIDHRLQLLREQSVAEGYGWPGIAMDLLWRPWLGAPLYGLATLGIRE